MRAGNARGDDSLVGMRMQMCILASTGVGVEVLFEAVAERVEGDHLLRDGCDEAHVDIQRGEEADEVLCRRRCSRALLACISCAMRKI